MVDAADLKSAARKGVWVRLPPWAPVVSWTSPNLWPKISGMECSHSPSLRCPFDGGTGWEYLARSESYAQFI